MSFKHVIFIASVVIANATAIVMTAVVIFIAVPFTHNTAVATSVIFCLFMEAFFLCLFFYNATIVVVGYCSSCQLLLM